MTEIEERARALASESETASTCTRCALADTRRTVVYGEGSPSAPLVFVGEGPGEREDATGRPFVGRAGALLDECLQANGIGRRHIYICNVVKCRACIIEAGRKRNRPPMADEIAACHMWLDRQLSIIAPLVIVCLGGPAASTLIQKGFRMLEGRGAWHTTSPYCRYIMAALHPAFILRQEGEAYERARQSLVDDIGAARRKVIEARREPPTTLF